MSQLGATHARRSVRSALAAKLCGLVLPVEVTGALCDLMQLELFNVPVPPADPNVHPDDALRLSGQNAAILERLKAGPATNRELYGICLRPSARIYDLKQRGYEIKSERIEGGLWMFTLRNG